MKKRTVILLIGLLTITLVKSQELGFVGFYSGSNFNQFHHTYGYGIEYYFQHSKTGKLGIRFQHGFCRGEYDRITPSDSDPFTKYIQKVTPKNQRLSFRINYMFALIHNPKSSLSAGPEFGLNFFFIDESYYQYEYGSSPEGYVNYQETERYRPGYGFLLEFQVNEVIGKNISVFSIINPEITSPENYGQEGVPNASLNTWMNISAGLRISTGKTEAGE